MADDKLHVHLHNPEPAPALFHFTPAMIEAAWARHSEISRHLTWSLGDRMADLGDQVREADALITWTGVILKHGRLEAPRLKLVQATSAGLDRIIPFTWAPPGCVVLNNSGVHAAKGGEYGLTAILAINNLFPRFGHQQRQRQWKTAFSTAIGGKSVLVVGLGAIGGAVAERAAAIGCRVTGVRTRPAPHPACAQVIGIDALDVMLPLADFVVVCTPLTEATRGLFSAERFARMKPGAGFVNLARGSVMDQRALADCLTSGHLGGAVIDVAVPEPLPPDDPLWDTPNLMITPHISSDDPDTYLPHTLDLFFKNLIAWASGQPLPNRVDPDRGY